ncbi:hypothetical protein F0U62_01130 [Cystobacter fuscus]|uniref:hypothetical protein n=1 Tax=Cystobacter fuscus TaxID=43 RepID=UPI002B2FBEE4|nr:hypothetical protein F0U62_01130 [Cystobacter fuscus]
MTVPQSPVLEFPAMLLGPTGAILRAVRTEGRRWAREYLKTGAFTYPRRMLQVPPGEVLIMHSGAEPDIIPQPRWRVHLFDEVFMYLNDGVPKEERQRMEESFESFCLSTPWGALHHAVSPPPPRSAERMAGRLAALLRFWDVLQGPRYAFWFDREYTLDELVKDIYGMTLEAWCPGGSASVREHLTLTVERMSRATREDCMEAVLRVIPVLVEVDTEFKHREELSDLGFLRERLGALRPEDFEDVSSAWKYTLTMQLAAWDRALGRH